MTRFTFFAWTATTIAAAVSIAAPTTAPSETPPAANAAFGQAPYSSVLVLPFVPVAGTSEWIGRAIQEDLATEMTRQSRLNVIAPSDTQVVSDAATAAKIGRDKGASLVVFGTYQIVDSAVRMNGELLDATSGKPLAALTTAGPERGLFHMEDELVGQALVSLPAALLKVQGGSISSNQAPSSTAPGPNAASSPYNSQGFYVTPGPDYAPYYDYSGGSAPAAADVSSFPTANPNDYPWYDDYPFWDNGFFFIGRLGDHRHDRDGRGNNAGESHNPQSSSGNGVRNSPVHSSGSYQGFHATAGALHSGESHR